MLNPLSILKVHALRDFASKIVVSRLLSEKLCSWQEKLVSTQQTNTHKVFPSQTGYNKRPRTTKFLRTSQDQSHAKPPTSGVLKSLITLGFLPQPHQKNTEHNTKLRTCTNCWRTNRGSYRVFAWNASSQSKNITQ